MKCLRRARLFEVLKHLRASERCGQTPVVVLSSSELMNQQNAEKNAASLRNWGKSLGAYEPSAVILNTLSCHTAAYVTTYGYLTNKTQIGCISRRGRD